MTLDQQNVTGRHYITTISDNATLTRGDHNISIGGSYRRTREVRDSPDIDAAPTDRRAADGRPDTRA